MPSENSPLAQRAWQAETGTWELLRQAARDTRTNATRAEALLWDRLRNRGLGYRLRRQHAIDRFIVDFYCREANLVVEVDGSSHDGREEEDAERQAEIGRRGLTLLRFTNREVEAETDSVLQKIASHLALTLPLSEVGEENSLLVTHYDYTITTTTKD